MPLLLSLKKNHLTSIYHYNNMNTNFYKHFSLVILFSFLASCSESQISISFDMTTTELKLGSSFTLTLPKQLPELAITDPDNNWFYLQGSSLKKTTYSQDSFTQLKKVAIDTENIHATHWIDGKENYSKIFTKVGTYTIYLSDNLETEPDNAITFIKKVRLIR